MKQNRFTQDEEFSGLKELDRLVLQVLAAVRDAGTVREAESPQDPEKVIYPKQWPPRRAQGEAETDEWGEAFQTEQEDWTPEPSADEHAARPDALDAEFETEAPPAQSEGPLTEAEGAFVERTVAWLARRSNRDIILDQVWRRLMSDDARQVGGDVTPAPPDRGPQDSSQRDSDDASSDDRDQRE
jgi:hypothetical protein